MESLVRLLREVDGYWGGSMIRGIERAVLVLASALGSDMVYKK